jgi:hypothetical protein
MRTNKTFVIFTNTDPDTLSQEATTRVSSSNSTSSSNQPLFNVSTLKSAGLPGLNVEWQCNSDVRPETSESFVPPSIEPSPQLSQQRFQSAYGVPHRLVRLREPKLSTEQRHPQRAPIALSLPGPSVALNQALTSLTSASISPSSPPSQFIPERPPTYTPARVTPNLFIPLRIRTFVPPQSIRFFNSPHPQIVNLTLKVSP